jgi:uncharacterized membrane protein
VKEGDVLVRVLHLTLIALFMFVAGVILILISVLKGHTKVGIFFIIPFFYSTDLYAVAGVLCIIGAMFCCFYAMLKTVMQFEPSYDVKSEKHHGGIVLIGPLPIIFGSSKTIVKWLIIGAIIVVITFTVLLLMFIVMFHFIML